MAELYQTARVWGWGRVGENGGEVSVGEIQPISPEALKAELEEMRETLAAAQSRANAAEERATQPS